MTTVPERWRKSSRSGQDTNCVELGDRGSVRDSKNPAGPRLRGAASLVAAAKSGQLGPK
jgi:hypothetical protein